MKLALSNIAWPTERDAEVAELLTALDVRGIEVAPTKVFADPLAATDAEIDAYRAFWNERGIEIVAAQALLFGRPELTLFDDAATREKTLAHLQEITRVCGRLGARALVFGSPKNRRVGDRDPAEAHDIAVDFFGRLADHAAACDTAIVLEANPTDYGADFITRADEALALVRAVNRRGFRLHLDAACMALAGDDPTAVAAAAGPLLAHYHISEPGLAPLGAAAKGGPIVDHARCSAALAAAGYDGWLSIEMRQVEPFTVAGLAEAVAQARRWYGSKNPSAT